MPAIANIPCLKAEIANQQAVLNGLRTELEFHTQGGNFAQAKRLRGEIADTEGTIKFFNERLVAAGGVLTDKQKADQVAANVANLQVVTTEAGAVVAAITKADQHLAGLIAALTDAHAHGAVASAAARRVIRQLPEKARRDLYQLANGLALTDTTLAAVIESAMQKGGLFETVAPAHWIRLVRHDAAPVAEAIEQRMGKLTRAVAKVAAQVNEAI